MRYRFIDGSRASRCRGRASAVAATEPGRPCWKACVERQRRYGGAMQTKRTSVAGALLLGLVGCTSGSATMDAEAAGQHQTDLAQLADLLPGTDGGDELVPLPGDTVLRVHYPSGAGFARMTVRGSTGPLSWAAGKTLTKVADGIYQLRIRGLTTALQWKPLLDDAMWSRGSNFRVSPGQTVEVYPHFVQGSGRYLRLSSFRSTILGNTRGVWLYLPPSFAENPLATYPVLVMHDGQNLFDPRYAFGGTTWQVAETLDAGIDALDETRHLPEVVVIGPENTSDRIWEYTPTVGTEPGLTGGGGDQYLRFLVEELLPQMAELTSPVQLKGRLRSGADNTALMGSSLGGLISAYAGVKRAALFGRIGAMSPSTWWDERFLLGSVRGSGAVRPLRVYLDSGDSGPSLDDKDNTQALAQVYRDLGYRDGVDLLHVIQRGASHSEYYWAQRLPIALQFLLAGL